MRGESLWIQLAVLQVLIVTFSADILSDINKGRLIPASGVMGSVARLPCDLTQEELTNSVLLVLWIKRNIELPVYTFDLRNRNLAQGRHRVDEARFGKRAYFYTMRDPPILSIKNLIESDEGIYLCRVDFENSPTRYTWVNLSVIVPPSTPVIFTEDGLRAEHVVGPYTEGERLALVCRVQGGKPRPVVMWWRAGSLMRGVDTSHGSGIESKLVIPALQRSDLRALLSCVASNHNETVPLSTAVIVEMTLPPLAVSILGGSSHLSAGKSYDLICQATGSRPEAKLRWWKGKRELLGAREEPAISWPSIGFGYNLEYGTRKWSFSSSSEWLDLNSAQHIGAVIADVVEHHLQGAETTSNYSPPTNRRLDDRDARKHEIIRAASILQIPVFYQPTSVALIPVEMFFRMVKTAFL
ncbi:unnamed protein product [Cyprideis torosa]|uniref:Uncharacterized protein n=1 Tax=Cyprideis torosa TaxID=163714 RepID=A0A7R8W541_9CRUS|nr:unnamed protein product [Cyprideis torosa]CAG0879446.1 unnamed protein product [Cyprideis torosa]